MASGLINNQKHVWVINHTSGYSKLMFGISTSNGYRENAATQNTAVTEYLNSHYGPAGIIMMDYAGTDSNNSYNVNGQSVTNAIINSNFNHGLSTTTPINQVTMQVTTEDTNITEAYNINGTKVNSTKQPGLYIVHDGNKMKKIVVR